MELQYANRLNGLSGNAIREIFKLLAKDSIISFAGGMPAGNTFPSEELARLSHDILLTNGAKVLQYGETEGWLPLKESALDYLHTLGIEAQSDELLIITGGQQGIDLLCKAFINPGDTILVENPTFLGAMHTMRTYEANIIPVDMEDDGVDLEQLELKLKKYAPKLLYLIPTFQNPTGKTLSLQKRKIIPALAAKYNCVVIEDDPYRALRYRGEELPFLKQFDADNNVIYVASFSKVISPGMRVGVAAGNRDIIRKMAIGKQAADVHTPILTQALVDAYLREGLLDVHIKVCIADYTIKKNAMQQAIWDSFPQGVKVTDPDGGLFIWAELPEHIHTLPLLERAVEKNVAFIPGEHFFADGSGKNTMRLNFSNASVEKIHQGIRALASIL